MSGVAPPIGVGVVGLGFMGRTHIGAYGKIPASCRLAGVFDLDRARLTGEAGGGGNIDTDGGRATSLFDPSEILATDSLEVFLASPEIHAVSVCTPTDTHAEVALAAIRAGKHVLIEKPVALDRRVVEQLADEARRAGVVAMPAMCMRFWPGWTWLREQVSSGASLRSLAFERAGGRPGWGGGFYQDASRSGGALYDLHIHDTDFVCHLLGVPDAVTTVGTRARMTTLYHFAGGSGRGSGDGSGYGSEHGGHAAPRLVTATGGWFAGGVDFRMRYLAEFDPVAGDAGSRQGGTLGTADFDLTRDEPLRVSRVPTGPGVDAQAEDTIDAVPIPDETGYDAEVRAFIEAVVGGGPAPVTLADASATLAVLEAEARSMETGLREPVRL